MKYQFTISGLLCLFLTFSIQAQDSNIQFDEATGNWGAMVDQDFTALVFQPTDAFLGIESNTLSKTKANKLGFANPYGSYVSKVYKNTAAHRAGLLPFDYLYGIGEYRTTRQSSIGDLLEEYNPKDWVDLHIIRNGKKMVVQAKLDDYSDVDEEDEKEEAFLGISRRGQSSEDMSGVSVNIVGNSTAQSMGMENGDKITHINGQMILDWDDISTAIGSLVPSEEIQVTFVRNGQSLTRSSPIKSYKDTQNEVVIRESDDDDWRDATAEGRPNSNKNHSRNRDQHRENHEQHHESAFLGINIASMSHKKAKRLGFDNPYGTYVSSVIPKSAADKGGMKALDYIYGIDEYRVGENQDLGDILKKYRAGDDAKILVSRKNQRKSIAVEFGSRNDKYGLKKKKNKCEDPFFGITNSSYDSDLGIKVNIVKNATSSDLKMKNGDIITHINGYRMVDWTDIDIAINMMNPGEVITVNFVRDGKKESVHAPIKSYADTKKCSNCDCNSYSPVTRFHDDDDDDDEVVKPDISNVEIVIVDTNSREIDEFTIRGIDPSNSNLNVLDLSILPNSQKGLCELKFELPSEGETIVKVFNENGRNIYEYDLGRFSGDFEDEVNLIQNGKGSFVLNITQDGKVMTKKIIVK